MSDRIMQSWYFLQMEKFSRLADLEFQSFQAEKSIGLADLKFQRNPARSAPCGGRSAPCEGN